MAHHGDGSIYQTSDGRWRGSLVVDGKRRYYSGKTRASVLSKLRDARGARERGELELGRSPRLDAWLDHWLTKVAPARCGESTLSTYETLIRNQINPRVGQHTLAKLQPDHLRTMYADMIADKRAPSTARQCHAILHRALKVAVREQRARRNVADLIDGPSVPKVEVAPLTRAQARTLIERAGQEPANGVRWVLALALGLRQGEALALEWRNVHLPPVPDPEVPVDPDADLPVGTLTVEWQLGRRRTVHGCGAKVKKLVKVRGKREKQLIEQWPCGKVQAARCPSRPHDGGLHLKRPKSAASRRVVAMPPAVTSALREHRDAQAGRRATAVAWRGWSTRPVGEERARPVDLVFCQPDGAPIDPRADYEAWQDFLAAAKIPPARLHDARHTAATVLLAMGVPVRAVSGMMGHSSTTLTQGTYQHFIVEVAEGVATAMDGALWGDDEVTKRRKARKAAPRAEREAQ